MYFTSLMFQCNINHQHDMSNYIFTCNSSANTVKPKLSMSSISSSHDGVEPSPFNHLAKTSRQHFSGSPRHFVSMLSVVLVSISSISASCFHFAAMVGITLHFVKYFMVGLVGTELVGGGGSSSGGGGSPETHIYHAYKGIYHTSKQTDALRVNIMLYILYRTHKKLHEERLNLLS